MTLTLLLDSSLSGMVLALFERTSPLGDYVRRWQQMSLDPMSKSDFINGELKNGLKALGATADSIAEVVVSQGPGSFTGIRVGLAWTYGFISARPGVRVCGVPGLALACQKLVDDSGLDAASLSIGSTKTHGYRAVYAKGSAVQCALVTTEEMVQIDSGHAWVEASWVEGIEAAGANAKPLHRAVLLQAVVDEVLVRLNSGNLTWVLDGLPKPHYLRKSSAEEKFYGG